MTSYEFRTHQIQEAYSPKGQGTGREYLNKTGSARLSYLRHEQACRRWDRTVGQAAW